MVCRNAHLLMRSRVFSLRKTCMRNRFSIFLSSTLLLALFCSAPSRTRHARMGKKGKGTGSFGERAGPLLPPGGARRRCGAAISSSTVRLVCSCSHSPCALPRARSLQVSAATRRTRRAVGAGATRTTSRSSPARRAATPRPPSAPVSAGAASLARGQYTRPSSESHPPGRSVLGARTGGGRSDRPQQRQGNASRGALAKQEIFPRSLPARRPMGPEGDPPEDDRQRPPPLHEDPVAQVQERLPRG